MASSLILDKPNTTDGLFQFILSKKSTLMPLPKSTSFRLLQRQLPKHLSLIKRSLILGKSPLDQEQSANLPFSTRDNLPILKRNNSPFSAATLYLTLSNPSKPILLSKVLLSSNPFNNKSSNRDSSSNPKNIPSAAYSKVKESGPKSRSNHKISC